MYMYDQLCDKTWLSRLSLMRRVLIQNHGRAVSSGLTCVIYNATDGIPFAVCPLLDIFLASGHHRV